MRLRTAGSLLALSAMYACSKAPAASHPALDAGATGGGGAGGNPACVLPAESFDAPPIHTPRWAFEPWISKDISSAPDNYAFVGGFHDRDIPVGAVVLDSPWETSYNTFVPNPSRYPGFPKIVADMHAQNVRVVLWITGFVNSVSYDFEPGGDGYPGPSPNLAEGQACNFFVEDGAQYQWWKGSGAAIDFFNPSAMNWWHHQQDGVLDAGIDGWKLDFGESYLQADPVHTAQGPVAHQAYSEAYYRDFLAYGAHRRGKEFVTMVRAWDKSYEFAGRFFARPEHAPVAWMGDNRRDWVGIADALDEMFRSANAGYAVVGSDIGGYLAHDDHDLLGPVIPFSTTVFARWTAVGALSPFMQLHGQANQAPWTVPDHVTETVALYRYWAKLHHELVPFFYSLAEEARHGGKGVLRPVTAEQGWPGDYRFTLGDAFLVAPLVDATGKREVALPVGAHYVDWWAQAAPAAAGGQILKADYSADMAKIPLFLRSGAIVPLAVSDGVTGLGTAASAGKLTVVVFPDATATSFALHDEDDAVTTIGASSGAAGATVTLSRALRDTLLRIRLDKAPTSVDVDGSAAPARVDRAAFDAAASGWFFEAASQSVWVKLPAGAGAHTVATL